MCTIKNIIRKSKAIVFQEEKILKQTKREILECKNWGKLAEYLNIKLDNEKEQILIPPKKKLITMKL